jgi:hypothetical protein
MMREGEEDEIASLLCFASSSSQVGTDRSPEERADLHLGGHQPNHLNHQSQKLETGEENKEEKEGELTG